MADEKEREQEHTTLFNIMCFMKKAHHIMAIKTIRTAETITFHELFLHIFKEEHMILPIAKLSKLQV